MLIKMVKAPNWRRLAVLIERTMDSLRKALSLAEAGFLNKRASQTDCTRHVLSDPHIGNATTPSIALAAWGRDAAAVFASHPLSDESQDISKGSSMLGGSRRRHRREDK